MSDTPTEPARVSITFTLDAERAELADVIEAVAREARDEDRQPSGYVRGPQGRPVGHWEVCR